VKGKIIGVSVAVILSLAAILLVSTVPYFILDDIPIEVKEYTSQKIVRTLTPTETIIVPEIYTLEIKEIKSSPIVEKTSEPTLSAQSFPFEAYAIGNTVNQIKFLKYSDSAIVRQHAFDSNHNLFTTKATTVSYFDRGLNTKTTWTIPELGSTEGKGSAVDSAGNYYYGQKQSILTKLVPSENKFIQISIVSNIDAIEISSSGEVYILAQGTLRKVNYDTGAVKVWSLGGNQFSSSNGDMALDSNDKIYYIGKNFQGEVLSILDPITNVATSWNFNNPGSSTQALAFDNNDDIFIHHFAGVRGKIQKLDPTTNVLEEWVVPTFGSFQREPIVVDSAGTVYFLNDLTRLVPSTGKFTQWGVFSFSQTGTGLLTVDSNDDLWIAGRSSSPVGFFGKVTAAP